MHPIDSRLYGNLSRMQQSLSGLIEIESRAVTMPKPSKIPMVGTMADELEPVLVDLYWFSLRNGIDSAPEDEEELKPWLERQLEKAAAVAALIALLLRFYKKAVNYGGSIALETLELAGKFELTSAAYLTLLDERATMLTSPSIDDDDMSLIDTTVNDLAREIPAARKSNDSTLAVLGAYIAFKALSRATAIATFEIPWGFNRGLGWTYKENGVKRLMYDVNGVGCPEICAPLHGRTMDADNIPSELNPPIHPNCDCVLSPSLTGWTAPATVWKGS